MRLSLWLSGMAVLLATTATASAQDVRLAADVRVMVDTSQAPEAKPWAETAAGLVKKWYPVIAELLQSDGFTPPREVKLVFTKAGGIAGTAGRTVYISSDWIKKHPGDFGMVIHEVVHVVQSYPKADPGWVTEGIADYIRFFHFEPKTKLPPINPDRAGYRDSYKTTAAFFAWIEKNHDEKIVNKLNRAMRASKYSDELFKESTGKTLDELWREYVGTLRK